MASATLSRSSTSLIVLIFCAGTPPPARQCRAQSWRQARVARNDHMRAVLLRRRHDLDLAPVAEVKRPRSARQRLGARCASFFLARPFRDRAARWMDCHLAREGCAPDFVTLHASGNQQQTGSPNEKQLHGRQPSAPRAEIAMIFFLCSARGSAFVGVFRSQRQTCLTSTKLSSAERLKAAQARKGSDLERLFFCRNHESLPTVTRPETWCAAEG